MNPIEPLYRASHDRLREEMLLRVFQVSSSMVGLCIAGIGLLRSADRSLSIASFADDLLAINALLFTMACLLSFWGLRTHRNRWFERIGLIAEGAFLLALVLMVVVAGIIVFVIV